MLNHSLVLPNMNSFYNDMTKSIDFMVWIVRDKLVFCTGYEEVYLLGGKVTSLEVPR